MANTPEYKPSVAIQPFQPVDVQQQAGAVSKGLMELAGETALTVQKSIVESEKAQAQVTLRENYTRIRDDVLDKPGLNMQKEFDTRWGAFSKGYMETVSRGAQADAKDKAAYYGIQGSALTGDKVRDLRTSIRQENFNEYYTTAAKDLSNQAFDGTFAFDKEGKTILDDKGKPVPLAAKTKGQMNDQIDRHVENGDITGSAGAALKKSAGNMAVKEGFTGQMDRILKSGDLDKRKPFLEAFQKSADLDRHDKDALMNKFKKMMKEYDEKGKNSKAALRDNLTGVESGLRSGTVSRESPEYVQAVEQAGLAGIDLGDWNNRFEVAESAHYLEEQIRSSNREEIKEMGTAYDAKEGDSPEILYRKTLMHAEFLAIVEKVNAERKANPVGFHQKSKAYLDTLDQRDVAAHDQYGDKVQGASLNPVDPLQTLENLQLQDGATTGLPTEKHQAVQIMDTDMAADEANRINSLPIEEQAPAFSEAIKKFPGREGIAAKDLERAGLDPQTITISNLYNDPRTKRYAEPMAIARATKPEVYAAALEGFKIPAEGSSSLDGLITSNKKFKLYNNALSNYNGQVADHMRDMRKSSKLLASQLTVKSKGDAKRSVDDAVNAMTNGLKFTSYNGKEFFHPDDISSHRLKTSFRAIEEEITSGRLKIYIPPETLGSLTPDSRQYVGPELVVGSSFWQSNPDKTSAVMVDSNSSPIKDLDGKVIEVLFDEMRKDGSDLNKRINHQSAKERVDFLRELKVPKWSKSNFLQDNLIKLMKADPEFKDLGGSY